MGRVSTNNDIALRAVSETASGGSKRVYVHNAPTPDTTDCNQRKVKREIGRGGRGGGDNLSGEDKGESCGIVTMMRNGTSGKLIDEG